jgi:hypothetical protein
MLKKNKKFAYVVLDKDNTILYINKNINKIDKFIDKYRLMFGISPGFLYQHLKLTTLDEYNKTHSEESIIDDMFKEWMNSRGNK